MANLIDVSADFNYKLATLEERHQLKKDGLDSEIVGLHGEMQALRAEYEEMRSKVDIQIENTCTQSIIQ